MYTRLISLVLFLFLICGCSRFEPLLPAGNLARVEARSWINDNPSEYPFAGNRFETKQEVLAFIDKLYESGAVNVYVTDFHEEEWRIKEMGGPYSETFIVELPKDPQQRLAIFKMYIEEEKDQGITLETYTGQNEIYFWWD